MGNCGSGGGKKQPQQEGQLPERVPAAERPVGDAAEKAAGGEVGWGPSSPAGASGGRKHSSGHHQKPVGPGSFGSPADAGLPNGTPLSPPAYLAASAEEAWGDYCRALGERDVDAILRHYCADSVVRIYRQEDNDMEVSGGVAPIAETWKDVFHKLGREPSLQASAPPLIDDPADSCGLGHVTQASVWDAPAAVMGRQFVSETVVLDRSRRFLRHNIVLTPCSPSRAPSSEDTDEDRARGRDSASQRAADAHLIAFAEGDADGITDIYREGSRLTLFDHCSQERALRVSAGVDAIRAGWGELLGQLADRAEWCTPLVHTEDFRHPEEAGFAGGGQTFLVWRSPTDGYTFASAVLVYAADGTVLRHDVAVACPRDT